MTIEIVPAPTEKDYDGKALMRIPNDNDEVFRLWTRFNQAFEGCRHRSLAHDRTDIALRELDGTIVVQIEQRQA